MSGEKIRKKADKIIEEAEDIKEMVSEDEDIEVKTRGDPVVEFM